MGKITQEDRIVLNALRVEKNLSSLRFHQQSLIQNKPRPTYQKIDARLAESRVAVVAGITYSNVTSRNISWYHFSWATLYIC